LTFAPAHRGGAGEPLVLLHGFMDTWRTWELVLPGLERRHDVLAPTLPGHAGGPPLPAALTDTTLVEGVEAAMDAAGWRTAHVAGNSLGGHVALQLAARGRARSVVALAPAGGWTELPREVFALQADIAAQSRAAAAHADALVATPQGRRQVTRLLTVRYEHIPAALLAHLIRGVAACDAGPLLAHAARPWPLEPVDCPVRIVWGTADALLPWPQAAARHRARVHADWVVLDDVGHAPQLDVPLEAAQLIVGHTAP
jgi:pimeloyl-ACP methyl ester carboxylesterase